MLPFHITYFEYLRATNAMEHVLLGFVRWQRAPSSESSGSFGGPGSAASLGVPRASETGFAVTRRRSQNRPLDQGNTRGFNPVPEPAPYACSA
jgi:hypothetical protein